MTPAEEGWSNGENRGSPAGLDVLRGQASRDRSQANGGPTTQEPSTGRGSSGGQQELGGERGDRGEEGPCTELRQAIFLLTKLRHIFRALRIEDHETGEPLEKNLHRREEQDQPRVTPSKVEGQKEGSGTSSRAESKNRTPQGPLGSPPLRPSTPAP